MASARLEAGQDVFDGEGGFVAGFALGNDVRQDFWLQPSGRVVWWWRFQATYLQSTNSSMALAPLQLNFKLFAIIEYFRKIIHRKINKF
jgi:hypothetical protein